MNNPDTTQTTPAVKPVLIVLTSHGVKGASGEPTGFYLGEATHPMAVLEDAGIPVELASIQGGESPVDGLDLDDAVNRRYWEDPAFRERLRQTPRLDAVEAARYSAILFAGGHGAVWDFPDSPAVQRQTQSFWEQGAIVAAVCHGPAALVNVKLADGSWLVAGRHLAAFTDDEERAVKLEHVVPFLLASTLVERGAIHHAAANWTPSVQVDGRLVTGQNPQSAHGVGLALRDLLLKTAR
ncbi:type 1 glutamine amidotransferase domain-containing protein [Rubrivivax gelatinosus]|uniref:type 1 glutamine amidotransferase domain-containing protein n=1 Tax=Rubrivivax gelatinosus TaxID=28068 RepID=UPI001903CEF9|nr:type 1 glutamine amidotransferase domain-containing protein [Rubrivivax gelatinosus]MBK1616281.1 type 1 glutamine amidotransferase domain-containing protein [Rubrivivax gelatinosus]